ncbi:MAG TPA: enoyl-CoA hydratase [Burkholderiales bacterium]|nr:enoyl-CoA hydratase [Burkholderiales bacterium]
MSGEGRLEARKDGAIGWLIFDNPARRNAVSLAMWQAMPGILERFDADPEVRLLVLAGAGERAFVSGADISQFESQRAGAEAVQRYEELAEGAQARLQEFDKPTIAMIRGYCLGAGVNIANVCDLRIAAEDARLGIPAAKVGLGYRASSTKNLVDVVGAAWAREMLITGRQYPASEAKAMGLVHHVVPVAELEAFTRTLAGEIAANAPLTQRTAKRIIRELVRAPRSFDPEQARGWVRECFESADYAEGRRAFMEKRKPVFTGK